MAVLGCHSCSFKPAQHPDINYQDSPCATCKLMSDSQKTFKHGDIFDSDAIDQLTQQIACQQQDQGISIPSNIPKQVIDCLQKACQNNMFITLSNIILKLVRMSKQQPTTVQVLIMKMQYPHKSYFQIGRAMQPMCSKQNVLYHLKRAVSEFPQLSKALLIDTRFSGNKCSAIQTIAAMRANNKAQDKLTRLLYKQQQHNKQASIQEINKVFNMPYYSDPAVFTNYQEN